MPELERSRSGPLKEGQCRRPRQSLRKAFADSTVTVTPGIYNGLSARLAAMAGFGAVSIGGSLIANTLLGLPDAGLLTLTEMEFVLSRVTACCEVPVLVDADSGYGNAINVVRTVRVLAARRRSRHDDRDQETPTRCGHVAGHVLVDASEMVGKVKAALDSRDASSFVIVARTDARSVEGIDAAIEQGRSTLKPERMPSLRMVCSRLMR